MNQNKKRNQVLEKIIGVVVLLIAFGAIVYAGCSFLKSQRTRNWPSVEGFITKSSTRIQRDPGTSGTPTTIADVWYTFVIDGVEYRNDTISLAQYGSSSASHAVKEAHRYPAGSKVMVFYNPENFHDSVLEHKTPWVFIGLFAGLGSILVYIGIVMLSGNLKTSPDAATGWHAKRESAYVLKKMPNATGRRIMIFIVIASVLIAGLGFYSLINDKSINREDTIQADTNPPERYQPQSVSTYSSKESSPLCEEWLKPNVAKSQKIQLKDQVHTLYVTATLCVDEEEMRATSQSRRTWPMIADQLSSYDKSVFDPESALLISNGEKTYQEFESKLVRIEQECLEHLQNDGIYFVKAIKFQRLQVFKEN
jgi:hypothetical protein